MLTYTSFCNFAIKLFNWHPLYRNPYRKRCKEKKRTRTKPNNNKVCMHVLMYIRYKHWHIENCVKIGYISFIPNQKISHHFNSEQSKYKINHSRHMTFITLAFRQEKPTHRRSANLYLHKPIELDWNFKIKKK